MELLRTLVVGGRLVAAAGVGSAGRGGPWDERCPSGEASGDLSTSPPFRCSPGASQHDGKSTRPVWPRRSRALAGDPVREARQRFPSPTGGKPVVRGYLAGGNSVSIVGSEVSAHLGTVELKQPCRCSPNVHHGIVKLSQRVALSIADCRPLRADRQPKTENPQ